jgi:hypothetical protein
MFYARKNKNIALTFVETPCLLYTLVASGRARSILVRERHNQILLVMNF